ncbi:hypothetical protein RND71_038534 [Anisodus tanguticus]|uniref:Transmembrane protein n=1 Tax=Anisodus tanguticus TaxID=243964 RepID=A0AAE1R055_9SOLA|nr:hypothetical protein RND71_038534 [Anisodus tanguticus]
MAKKNGRGCIAPNSNSEFPWIKFSAGMGVGFMSLVVGTTWLYFSIKKRKLIKLVEKFFQQNGGLLLKQRISFNEGDVEVAIELENLRKFTKNNPWANGHENAENEDESSDLYTIPIDSNTCINNFSGQYSVDSNTNSSNFSSLIYNTNIPR